MNLSGNYLSQERAALPFYRSCANINIKGGLEINTQSDSGCTFEWEGGRLSFTQCYTQVKNTIQAIELWERV